MRSSTGMKGIAGEIKHRLPESNLLCGLHMTEVVEKRTGILEEGDVYVVVAARECWSCRTGRTS